MAASSLFGTTIALVTSTGRTYGSGIGNDRSKIAQLEQEISYEGQVVQTLVSRYDSVEGHLLVVRSKITTENRQVASDKASQSKAQQELQTAAIAAYVNAGTEGATSLIDSSNASTAGAQQVYLGVESGMLNQAVANYQAHAQRTAGAEALLGAEEKYLTHTLKDLSTAQAQAQAAVQRDEALLASVKGNLLKLVLAAERKKQEQALAAQELLAAKKQQQQQQQASQPQPPPPPPPPVPQPQPQPQPQPGPVTSSGSYANPLRAIGGLTANRIDQGVDYDGYGPIYAIGDGVVLSTVNGGWPGGTFIAYQLTDGPAKGLVAYAAEDINPQVSVGQTVTANTVLGQMYMGPTGIETGWADGSALGETMASAAGQFYGSNSTAYGANFSQLLASLGAPAGVPQNNPGTGSLPSGWPNW